MTSFTTPEPERKPTPQEPPAPRRADRKNLRQLAGVLRSLEYLATEWGDPELALSVAQARREGLRDPRFLFDIYKVLAEFASSEVSLSIDVYEWLGEHPDQVDAEGVASDVDGREMMKEVADLLAIVSRLIIAASTAKVVKP